MVPIGGVTAAPETLATRLGDRGNDDTRFDPTKKNFRRGIEGIETIQEYVEATDPESMTVENETEADLATNATRIAEEIVSRFDG